MAKEKEPLAELQANLVGTLEKAGVIVRKGEPYLAGLLMSTEWLIRRLVLERNLRVEGGRISVNGTCGSAEEICEWASIKVGENEKASDAIKKRILFLENENIQLKLDRKSTYIQGWSDCREAIVKAIGRKYNETVDDIGQMKSIVESQARSLRVNRSKLAALLEQEEAFNRSANIAANVESSDPAGDELRKDVVADNVQRKNPA